MTRLAVRATEEILFHPGQFAFWPLRQPQLPAGYGVSFWELEQRLRITAEGVLLFRHPKAGFLPVGRVGSSRLICYRSAISFWGQKELRQVRVWWRTHYAFNADELGVLLILGVDSRVRYRGRLIGLVEGDILWFMPLVKVIYNRRQLRLMCRHLEHTVGHKLAVHVFEIA